MEYFNYDNMEGDYILNNTKKQKPRIMFIIITIIFLFFLTPSIASANPVSYYDFGLDIGLNIFLLFFANLIIDGLILLIPIFILSKIGLEKKVSELWIFGLPLLAIWGAYIDIFYIKINLITENVSNFLMSIVFIISLFLIFLSYFFVIHVIMDHKIKTGIIIGITGGFINAIFWSIISYNTIYHYSNIPLTLVHSGFLVFIFLIILMIWFLIRKIIQKNYYNRISGPNPNIDNALLKSSVTIIHTFFLLFLAFTMMVYLV